MMRTTIALGVVLSGVAWGTAEAAGGSAQEVVPLYRESLRPQFHFSARYWDDYVINPQKHQEGWINDVNGLVYHEGEYHLFAQRWWSCWLHAVSRDLVHWQELRPAFGKGGQFGGTQSGGAVVDHRNTSGLGRDGEPPMLAFWSSTDNRNQCMSYSQDRGRTWMKYENNPVLEHPYRDPNVFWYEPDNKWVMVLYGPEETDQEGFGTYGFNGEFNDAHDLLKYRAGEWNSSVVLLRDDGRVTVSDSETQATREIDIGIQDVAGEVFYVGSKAGKSEFLNGDVAVVVVYDRALSDAEAGQLTRYLSARGGSSRSAKSAAALRDIPPEGLVLCLDAREVEVGADDRVSRWRDLSGHGRDMVQGGVDHMPTRVEDAHGGVRAIRFRNGQYLQGPAVLSEGDDTFTIAALWRRDHLEGSEVVCEQNSSVVKQGRRAALLAQGRRNASRNCYLLFESKNLLEWRKLPTSVPNMFECPDMFPLYVEGDRQREKWVMVDGSGEYVIGWFDGQRFESESGKMEGDYGRNFYATMTFACMPERDNRRIQMAWMQGGEYPDMPFNQQISFPCELSLRELPEGIRLCRYPAREIEKLYADEFALSEYSLKPGINPLSKVRGELFDVRAEMDLSGSNCEQIVFDVRGSRVVYEVREQMLESCGTRATLRPRDGRVQVRILVDRMSVETFGNRGEVSITNVAQAGHEKPPLSLSAEGGEVRLENLTVHTLQSIWE